MLLLSCTPRRVKVDLKRQHKPIRHSERKYPIARERERDRETLTCTTQERKQKRHRQRAYTRTAISAFPGGDGTSEWNLWRVCCMPLKCDRPTAVPSTGPTQPQPAPPPPTHLKLSATDSENPGSSRRPPENLTPSSSQERGGGDAEGAGTPRGRWREWRGVEQ